MTFSVWGWDGVGKTVALGKELVPEERRLYPRLERMWVFEAESWQDAFRQFHEQQERGWGSSESATQS